MRETKTKETLQVALTDAQKIEYSKALSEHISKKARAEDSLKSMQSSIKAEIASHDAQINCIAETLNNGFEYRSVDVAISFNFEKKIKEYFRCDTSEKIRERPLSEEELQEELNLVTSGNKTGEEN